MKNSFRILIPIVAVLVLLSANTAEAQFVNGSFYVGPEIGVPSYGTGAAAGLLAEFPLTDAKSFGPGILALGIRGDYWTTKDPNYLYHFLAISAMANYHFPLDKGKFDPFIGAGLGYDIVGTTQTGTAPVSYKSRPFFTAQVGSRYFLTSRFDFRAQVGFGDCYLALGFDFRL